MLCVQVIDILLGYIDVGVMMQKPSSAKEPELRDHYKVGWALTCQGDLVYGECNTLIHLNTVYCMETITVWFQIIIYSTVQLCKWNRTFFC